MCVLYTKKIILYLFSLFLIWYLEHKVRVQFLFRWTHCSPSFLDTVTAVAVAIDWAATPSSSDSPWSGNHHDAVIVMIWAPTRLSLLQHRCRNRRVVLWIYPGHPNRSSFDCFIGFFILFSLSSSSIASFRATMLDVNVYLSIDKLDGTIYDIWVSDIKLWLESRLCWSSYPLCSQNWK